MQSGNDQQMHRARAPQQRPVGVGQATAVAGGQGPQVGAVAAVGQPFGNQVPNALAQINNGRQQALARADVAGAVNAVAEQPTLIVKAARILVTPRRPHLGFHLPSLADLDWRWKIPVQAQAAAAQVHALGT